MGLQTSGVFRTHGSHPGRSEGHQAHRHGTQHIGAGFPLQVDGMDEARTAVPLRGPGSA